LTAHRRAAQLATEDWSAQVLVQACHGGHHFLARRYVRTSRCSWLDIAWPNSLGGHHQDAV